MDQIEQKTSNHSQITTTAAAKNTLLSPTATVINQPYSLASSQSKTTIFGEISSEPKINFSDLASATNNKQSSGRCSSVEDKLDGQANNAYAITGPLHDICNNQLASLIEQPAACIPSKTFSTIIDCGPQVYNYCHDSYDAHIIHHIIINF